MSDQVKRGCYVASWPTCGCRLGVVVDTPDHPKDVAKFIAEQVRHGLRVDRLETCDEFRKGPFGCKNEDDCQCPMVRKRIERERAKAAK